MGRSKLDEPTKRQTHRHTHTKLQHVMPLRTLVKRSQACCHRPAQLFLGAPTHRSQGGHLLVTHLRSSPHLLRANVAPVLKHVLTHCCSARKLPVTCSLICPSRIFLPLSLFRPQGEPEDICREKCRLAAIQVCSAHCAQTLSQVQKGLFLVTHLGRLQH